MSERPKWLDEFRKRTQLIDVIDAAFDEDVSDAEVRKLLRDAAQGLGDLFMPEAAASRGSVPSRQKRKRR